MHMHVQSVTHTCHYKSTEHLAGIDCHVNARPIRQFVDQSQCCTGKEEEVGEEEEREGEKKGEGRGQGIGGERVGNGGG